MDELLHNDRWVLLANHSRSKVEVVIVQHDNRYSLTAHNFGIDSVSNRAIGDIVTILPGILHFLRGKGVLHRIVQVVL